jgi:nucleoside-diphosphate-sugar epimerase
LKVLVIGGRGFIGRRAADALRQRGHDVWTLNRTPAEGQYLVGDRSRPEGLAQALAGRRFEAIVDLAAFHPREVRDVVALFANSVRRYVLVSSGAVYQGGTGSDEEQAPILEGEPPEELDYAMGKRWCESVLARAVADGFPGVVLRPPAVLGAHDHTSRIAGYLARIEDGGPLLVLVGLSDAAIGVGWSKDVGIACAYLSEGAGTSFAYNVGFANLTLRPFINECAAALGLPVPALVETTEEDLGRAGLSLFDFSPYGPASARPGGWTVARIRDELGFESSSLRAALDECVSWFRTEQPRPHGYEHRRDEFELADRLRRTAGS